MLSIVISIHLYDEEKIYHSCNYPDKKDHDLSHISIAKSLEEMTNSLTSKEYSKNEKMKLICKFLNEVLPFDEDSDRKLGNYIYQQYLLNGNISLSSEYGTPTTTSPLQQLSLLDTIPVHIEKTFTIDDNDRLTIPEPTDEAIKRGRSNNIGHSNSNSSCEIIEEKTDVCDLANFSPNKKRK